MKKLLLILMSFIIFNSTLPMEVGEDEEKSKDSTLVIFDGTSLPQELWLEILLQVAVMLNPDIPKDTTDIYDCLGEIADEVKKNIVNLRCISKFFNVLLKTNLQDGLDAKHYNQLLKNKCIFIYRPIIRKHFLSYNLEQKRTKPLRGNFIQGDFDECVIEFLSFDNCGEFTSSEENLNERILQSIIEDCSIVRRTCMAKKYKVIPLLIFCGAKILEMDLNC